MKLRLPVGRLLTLASHVGAASKGGISHAEARKLGVEAFGIGRIMVTPFLPPTIAPVVSPVLDVIESMIGSPPASVEDAAHRIIGAVSGMLPAEVEIEVGEGG